MEIIRRISPRRGSGSAEQAIPDPWYRKARTIAALLLLVPLIAGCVRAEFEIVLLPDGSGALTADVAYAAKKWPVFFGDPFESFLSPNGFRGMMPPGFVAWSQPVIDAEDGWRHLRTAAWFDDIRRIVLPARRSDETPYAALRFSGNPPLGELRLLSELDSILARPVPLPSPQEMGMEGVSIPGPIMDGVRKQMGTILSGLDVTLRLNPTGTLYRADGFDSIENGDALIRVNASRGAAAFQSRAGVLTDVGTLTSGDARWQWEPAEADSTVVKQHRAARDAAVKWFSGN